MPTTIDDPTGAEADAVRLLEGLGAGGIAHPGGVLLDHLRRTGALLRSWGAADALCLAGLCHAAYGTDGFPVALLGLDERERLRDVVGDEAEGIVHRYCACDRGATYPRLGTVPLPLTDRFSGTTVPLDAAAAGAFATLTLANELDVVRHADLSPAGVDGIVDLFRALAPHAPEAAARALSELAAA